MIAKTDRILITGAHGLVGTALLEELKREGYSHLIPFTRHTCDLTQYEAVKTSFALARPDVVIHAAGAVYGIGGNAKYRSAVFTQNILINTHVIEASRLCGVKKIVAMSTVAAYPDPKEVPIKEEQIWEGPPHGSESGYGHAKRAMLAHLLACQEESGLDFAYILSTNLFGMNDKFDCEFGHVVPSLIRKFYEAKRQGKEVVVWGSQQAARDFLYAKDMARALILIMNQYVGAINVAYGKKVFIKDVVQLLTDFFEMHGKVRWDARMPDGRMFHEVDLRRLKSLGFEPAFPFDVALRETVDWFNINFERELTRC